MEAQIAALRAELLHKEQENERVQLQLAKEKEERERAERQVTLTGLCNGAPVACPTTMVMRCNQHHGSALQPCA